MAATTTMAGDWLFLCSVIHARKEGFAVWLLCVSDYQCLALPFKDSSHSTISNIIPLLSCLDPDTTILSCIMSLNTKASLFSFYYFNSLGDHPCPDNRTSSSFISIFQLKNMKLLLQERIESLDSQKQSNSVMKLCFRTKMFSK